MAQATELGAKGQPPNARAHATRGSLSPTKGQTHADTAHGDSLSPTKGQAHADAAPGDSLSPAF